MYFQYDTNDIPLGFIYNGTQYFYLTNQMGDVIALSDSDGNVFAEYTYDAWGSLQTINTADENTAEQLAIANANPLRYRGYYYDNETGYYYLQSRYYNHEWGRFISADSFAYLDTENSFSLNAYIYCWNCPTIFEDAEGTTPKISIDISKIQAFVVKIQVFTSNVKDKLSAFGNRILASLQKTVDRCKQLNEKIKCKFTALGEKIKFKLHNFNISINKAFKEITGRDLNIFKIVEFIIERVHNNENDEQSTSVRKAKSKTSENSDKNNVTMAVFQGLFGGIILNTINNVFNAIHIDLEDLMNKSIKNNWYGLFKELMFTGVSVLSAGSVILKDYFQIANMFEKGYNGTLDWMKSEAKKAKDWDAYDKGDSFLSVMSILSAFISFSESMDNAGNGALSKNADITLACVKLVFNLISPFVNINPALAVLLSFVGDIIPKVIAMRVEGIAVC